LVIGDSQPQGQARVEVAFGFRGLRGRFDGAQGPDPVRAALAYLAQQRERLLAVERVGEEDLEQARVPQFKGQGFVPGEPVPERRLSGRGDGEDPPGPPALRVGPAGDEPGLLEKLQAGIDLGLGDGPEEPDRVLDHLLDLIARSGAETHHTEHDVRRGAELSCDRWPGQPG
jgi:hypothetical protein